MNVLYLSYDGVLDPLGQTQILPYLRGLAHQYGHRFVLVSYEKPHVWHDSIRRQAVSKQLLAEGITWLPLKYHKWPSVLATLFDVARGIAHCTTIIKRFKIQAVHSRSYVPMLIALPLKYWFGLPLVFDMRGLWADERADVGACTRASRQYRAIKALERASLRHSDHIITLTQCSLPALHAMSVGQKHPHPITVIPCCTDTHRWRRDEQARQHVRHKHGWEHATVLVYSGSLGGWYRTADLARLFATWQQHDSATRLLVLANNTASALIAALTAEGVAPINYTIKHVQASDVPMWLSAADAGLSLVTPSYSKIATSPTKYAEYLACGLPIIANKAIGDTAILFDQWHVGIHVHDFTPSAYSQAWHDYMVLRQDPTLSQRCRAIATQQFDLQRAVQSYYHIYQALEKHNL